MITAIVIITIAKITRVITRTAPPIIAPIIGGMTAPSEPAIIMIHRV